MLTKAQKKNLHKLSAELRSGLHKQCTGSLRNVCLQTKEVSYCCLGLAEDLYRRIKRKGKWDGSCFKLEGDLDAGYLEIKKIQDYFGMNHREGFKDLSLANLNDLERKSFSEIADAIDKYIEDK